MITGKKLHLKLFYNALGNASDNSFKNIEMFSVLCFCWGRVRKRLFLKSHGVNTFVSLCFSVVCLFMKKEW